MLNKSLETKTVAAIRPVVATGTLTSITIDRANYQSGKFLVSIGAVTGDFTSIKVAGSNASNFSSPVDLFEANAAAITAAEAGSTVIGRDIDLRNAPRYLQIQVVKASGNAAVAAVAILSNPNATPLTTAELGYGATLVPA